MSRVDEIRDALLRRRETLTDRALKEWRRWSNGVLPVLDKASDNELFRVPTDLQVTPTDLRRVLVVGQCLMGWLPLVAKRWHLTCQVDLVLFNNLSVLPDEPPGPPDDYDFQIVQVPMRQVLLEHVYYQLPYDDPGAWERFYEECRARMADRLRDAMAYNERFGILSLVTNFLTPQQNPMGRLLPRDDLRNLVHFVSRLNDDLSVEVASYSNSYVIDVDQVAADFGRKFVQDDILLQSGHGGLIGFNHLNDSGRLEPPLPFPRHYSVRTEAFHRAVWAEAVALHRTVRRTDAVKAVVVDLDDTLWRGVLAEAGEDLSVHDATEGWPLGVAEALAFLKKRGILLAIVSKNDEQRIEEMWDHLFRGRLLLSDFAVRKINWRPKVENMGEVLAELNILPDTVVFLDDNPVERAAIRHAYPSVRVLGSTLYSVRRILLWSAETQVAAISSEASRRTEMVRAQIDREAVRSRVPREEFLRELGVRVRVDELAAGGPKFDRAVELLNRTNQFNTTGRRWTSAELAARRDGGWSVLTFDVEDRFTSYGLVGVLLFRSDGDLVVLEQVVMSCRVFGLDVELAVMADLLERARRSGATAVSGVLVETAANGPVRDLFTRAGFTPGPDGTYRAELTGTPAPPPTFVELA